MKTANGGNFGKVIINLMSRKKKRKTGRLVALFLLATIIFAISIVGWYKSTLNTPFDSGSNLRIKFEISAGDTAGSIVENLKKSKLIRSESALLWYIKQEDIGDQFKVGSFALQPNMTPLEIVEELTSNVTGEKWITIIEGWSNHQIAEYLEKEGWGSYEEIRDCMRNCEFDYDFLSWKPAENALEGFLYPDSYIITDQYIPKNILKRMLDNFDLKTKDLRIEATKRKKNFYEILIMASMIEKEVREYEDKQIVSGILWNRLEYGTPLGVDATVLYARDSWGTPITQEDLQIDSPYNTRKYAGLPPGPICNPSVESIKAALNPIETDYYFYITEPENGKVIYSRNLEEHNENVWKYLR